MSFILPERSWKNEPQTPQRWLELATDGLSDEAAGRVRTEYLDHLTDAQQAGETVAEVVRGWGDPHAANRQLKRVHLLKGDERYVPAGYAAGWRGLAAAYREDLTEVTLAALGLTAFWLWISGGQTTPLSPLEGLAFAVMLTAGVILPLLRWLLLRRPPVSQTARVWLWALGKPQLWMAAGGLGLILWQLSTSRGPEGGFPVLAFVGMMLWLSESLSRLQRGLRVARKL